MAYLVLNPKELTAQIEQIRNHIEHNGPVIFSEVTNTKVTDEFVNYFPAYFIDPQHTFSGQGGYPDQMETQFSDLSATLYSLELKGKIHAFLESYCNPNKYPNPEVLYVLEKVDMDALAAVVICELTHNKVELNPTLMLNANSIHEVDYNIMPKEWNPDFIQSYEIKWTNILGAATSDFNVPIENRISIMEDFLLTDKLPEQYRKYVEKEWQLLQQATVETLSGITVVTSAARGASGLIYKQAPFGIAYCDNFMGKGAKYTFMEFTAQKYLDLAGFFDQMNEHYPSEYGTFGGNVNAGIGGSYIPCELTKETLAAELAKFVL